MSKFLQRAWLLVMAVLLLAATFLKPIPLQAQTSFGSVVGTITDPSGAVVPDAAVTLTNVATNEQHTAQTNSAGQYSFVSLQPATYTVGVEKSGFKRFVREQVTVEVNQTVRVDAALQLGAATETVEVSTETPLLQTDSGTLSDVIEGKTVNEMPLNGRNTLNLLDLAPGVIPTNNTAGGAALGSGGHTATSNWSAYSIGGGLVGQSTMYLDGMPLNVLGGGGGGSISFVPTQDAVQEFNVATNASTSEFGRYSGGVVNMATKSGTNAWHGSIYEYVRNQILNANEFFNKQSELSKGAPNKPAQWNQNQYGAEIGGPIKKDKLFAMFSWEAFSARESSLQTRTVPTLDMLSGIIDGRNVAAQVNAIRPQCNAVYNSTTGNTVLNGGVMTAASGCFDPSALVMMTEWPKPNAASNVNNFQALSGYGSDYANYIGRLDYVVSEKQRLFGRIVQSNLQDLSQDWMPGGIMPSGQPWNIGGGTTENRTTAGVLGDTYTVNPNTIVDLRFSISRVYNTQVPPTAGSVPLSIFGSNWAALAKSETITNIPQLNFTDTCVGYICTPTSFGNAGQDSYQWNDNEGLVFSLTKIAGQHSLKMGGEVRFMDRYVLALSGNNAAGGSFTFNSTYFTQSAWGNFLLGMPNSSQMNTVRKVASYNWYQGYYINDTWQTTKKLTINAGVRYELPGNIKEKHDDSIELQPALTTPYTAGGTTYAVPGSAVLVNSPAYPDRGSEPARHDLFAPNLGFAYRITDNDVVHGGYGYSIAAIDIASGLFPENFSLNAAQTSWNYAQTGVWYPLSNPFPTSVYPNGLLQPIPRSAFSSQSLVGQSITAPTPTSIVPTTQQWNVAFSHQFGGDLMIEAGYAGSKANGLPMTYSYNELGYNYWNDPSMPQSTSTAVSSTLVNSSQLALCKAVWGSAVKYGQCARPYAGYSGFTDALGPYGFLNYQSLPVRVQKRFRSGGMVSASYTWSKTLGNTGGGIGNGPSAAGGVQDWYNLRGEKSVTSYNVPRRFVASYVLPLPIGRGQLFLKNLDNPVANRIISGWTVNGITTFQDGFPLGMSLSLPQGTANVPQQFGSGLRPNYQFGCPKMTGGSWTSHVFAQTSVLNNCWSAPPIAYTITSPGPNGTQTTTGYSTTLGNESRIDDTAKAPGQNNWDLTLQKTTSITERVNLEFRWEMFNAFNHVRFPAPATQVGNNGFGLINGSGQGENQPRLDQLSLRLNF